MRSTIRPALATMLATATNDADGPLFNSVWDRMPPRVPKNLWPGCVVLVPEQQDDREALRGKLQTFGCQLMLFYGLPSTGWPAEGTGTQSNLYLAPDGEPEVVFDELLDQLIPFLRTNQAFTQNVPGGSTVTVQLGQKITVKTPTPRQIETTKGLTAVVQFPVTEYTSGV